MVLGFINNWRNWPIDGWAQKLAGILSGICTECAWVAYSIQTKQWGFIFGSTVYISAYLFNINKWLDEVRKNKIRNMFTINPLHNYRKNKNNG